MRRPLHYFTLLAITLTAMAAPLMFRMGEAWANGGQVSITCSNITVHLNDFPAGEHSGTLTINGVDTPFSFTGSSGTVTAARPSGPVQVYWSASTGQKGELASGSGYSSGADCGGTTTTTPAPTTTTVAPCTPATTPTTQFVDQAVACPPPTTVPPVTVPHPPTCGPNIPAEEPCIPVTVPPTVVPPTTVPPTTAVPPSSTTVPVTTPPTTTPVTVPPAVVCPTGSKDPKCLAYTGSNSAPLVLTGSAMLLLGLPLLAVRRRKTA